MLLVTVDRELTPNDLNSLINVLACLCENSKCGTPGMVWSRSSEFHQDCSTISPWLSITFGFILRMTFLVSLNCLLPRGYCFLLHIQEGKELLLPQTSNNSYELLLVRLMRPSLNLPIIATGEIWLLIDLDESGLTSEAGRRVKSFQSTKLGNFFSS